jgi:hypothetical protein
MSTFSVGDPVWVYERSLYPVEATISKVVECATLTTDDGKPEVLGYEVSQSDSIVLKDRLVGSHNIWRRPEQRRELLKELRDDIEFLETYVAQIEREGDES